MTNEEHIATLHPEMRPLVEKFLVEAKKDGLDLKITQSRRTFPEQQVLYDKGRTTPGPIVTKAKPGQSFHNYDLAVDVVPIVKGKADWEGKQWARIGMLGTTAGLEWGGSWKTFKDLPHFQYPKDARYQQLLALKKAGKVNADGYLILDSMKKPAV